MADNTQLPIPSTSGDVIAADDIAGVKYQRVKLIHGADGVNDGDVSSANPLPTVIDGVATEATLSSLSAKINNTPIGAILSGTASDRFFDNFASFDTTNTWELVQTGTGMTVSGPLGGVAAGSSPYINIASGTTIDKKTIILSRTTFNSPFDLRYQITASQRIANNRCLVGFVQVDDSGAIVTDTTRTTAPAVLDARNAVFHQHDGTVATTSNLIVRAAGSAIDTFANAFGTGFTTVATGTSPNFLSATTYGLTVERDKINSRAYGQNVTTNTGGQFSYDRILVNPTVKYKLCIIVENLGTAPASSTDWRIHLVNVMDATRFDVSPRNAGTADLAKSFPITGQVTVSGTQTANVTFASAGGTIYNDTTTNLTGGATFTGTSRDAGATNTMRRFCAAVAADQSGTLFIQCSNDNTTWRTIKSLTLTAPNAFGELEVNVCTRYHRVVYTNGATAQGAFLLNSAYHRV